jgi:hypothetical protein
VPLLDVDETGKTATLRWNPTAPFYSFFGGNAAVLKNGDVEYCESAGDSAGDGKIGRCRPLDNSLIGAKEFRVCIRGFSGDSAQVERASIVDRRTRFQLFDIHLFNVLSRKSIPATCIRNSLGHGAN